MSDAMAIAVSGLRSSEYYINNIANDLANLNTPNYKANKLTFTDMVYRNLHADNLPRIGLGTSVYKTEKDFSQGPLKPTNNWNDVAINGVGFFQILNHDGRIIYTRNSNFTLDEDHYLATQDGFRLADNIQVPDDFIQLTIKTNGEVEATRAADPTPQLLGTIQLAKFSNPETLESLGAGVYANTKETEDPFVDNPGSNGLGSLMQNQVEGSNVDMMHALMQLTMAQRVYQLNAAAVHTADELEKVTNELLG